jgi:hypothetical protein
MKSKVDIIAIANELQLNSEAIEEPQSQLD